VWPPGKFGGTLGAVAGIILSGRSGVKSEVSCNCVSVLRQLFGFSAAKGCAAAGAKWIRQYVEFDSIGKTDACERRAAEEEGGLAIAIPHGPGVFYNSDNNFAPTVGGRFTF